MLGVLRPSPGEAHSSLKIDEGLVHSLIALYRTIHAPELPEGQGPARLPP